MNNIESTTILCDKYEKSIKFKFNPLDHVIVTAYGLHYPGRVLEAVSSTSGVAYLVEYAYDGKIDARRFCEDELTGKEN